MGRALSRLIVERGEQVFLLGVGAEELARSAADLAERGGGRSQVGFAECDLENPATFQSALDAAHQHLSGFDTVIVTAGLFGTQERLEEDLAFTHRMLSVNFSGTIVFCEMARKFLARQTSGTLCVFSSVAGDRARKPVVLYGASKAGLSAYLEGLDHRYRLQGLRTICVKPGFVKTAMTAGLKAPPFAGEPEQVARQVLKAIDRGTPVVYTPPIWQVVLLVIRWLPRMIMRRIGF
jgi:decaprenylphospho-beta-D-erythro-pentofuranosid-2-ulose 2-reductase